MKNLTLLIFSFFIGSICFAQGCSDYKKVKGNGKVVEKVNSVEEYDRVKVKGSLDVTLIKGKEGEIKLRGESNLLDYIVTEVKGDVLSIRMKKGIYFKYSPKSAITITVPFEDLSGVALTGSGDVTNDDVIETNNFEVNLTGSGDVSLTINSDKTEATVTGSGDLVLAGTTNFLEGNITGSGDLNSYKLNANMVEANVTGSGDFQLTANNSLNAQVSGSGDIAYKGNPSNVEKKVNGSGDIVKK